MSQKTKVVVTRQLNGAAQTLLESHHELEIVQWNSEKPAPRPWLLQNAPGASGLLVMLSDTIDAALLETCTPTLKTIASFSVGTDHITLPLLKTHNIRLGYTPTALTSAVADTAIMLTLMAQRRAGEAVASVKAGEWPAMPWAPQLLTGPQIAGCTVGFVGFGRIGQAVLKRFVGFGVRRAVYLTSRPGEVAKVDYFDVLGGKAGIEAVPARGWEDLGRESDVVVLGCALTESTRHFVGREFLALMKRTAVLVNVARGPVVDTEALVEALREGRIFGAGLDVVEGEPNVPADHPLLKEPRCVLLPHIGSATIETREQMAEESVRNLLAGLSGEAMVNEVEL
ncbi:glyoxylate reductase [Massarina eburnea CBS 473.64]|uniref:Glyoxylate reductase n=1 Tax=Massarina eburnea CBS 473.64 TaxID=1395130 RepID=A0A6A6SBF2_9PLEO|nr:glyoxylate reductase [Massarina eburnea CBS 473.64]